MKAARSICPLFIPLRREFFEAFKAGTKDTEYRKRGARWNMETCWIGRTVILSLGYGKAHRLTGKIVGCHYDNLPSKLPGWVECYGSNAGAATCIKIELDDALQCPLCKKPLVDVGGYWGCLCNMPESLKRKYRKP